MSTNCARRVWKPGSPDPQLVVQEHPDRVQFVQSGPTQFGVDAPRVVGARLKHLELVDRRGGDEFRADRPTLRLIPPVGSIRRPSTGLGEARGGPPKRAAPAPKPFPPPATGATSARSGGNIATISCPGCVSRYSTSASRYLLSQRHQGDVASIRSSVSACAPANIEVCPEVAIIATGRVRRRSPRRAVLPSRISTPTSGCSPRSPSPRESGRGSPPRHRPRDGAPELAEEQRASHFRRCPGRRPRRCRRTSRRPADGEVDAAVQQTEPLVKVVHRRPEARVHASVQPQVRQSAAPTNMLPFQDVPRMNCRVSPSSSSPERTWADGVVNTGSPPTSRCKYVMFASRTPSPPNFQALVESSSKRRLSFNSMFGTIRPPPPSGGFKQACVSS